MEDSTANFAFAGTTEPTNTDSAHAAEIQTPDSDPLFSDTISADISRRFEAARRARRTEIEAEMLADMRRRDGVYEPDIISRLQSQGGGSTVFDNITDTKCSGVEASLADIFFFSGDKGWSLEPTPIPELDELTEREAIRRTVELAIEAGVDPATAEDFDAVSGELQAQIRKDIEAEAKARAQKMEKLIEDQLAEGGFNQAMNDFIVDLSTHKVAALMGPMPRIVKKMAVRQGDGVVEMAVEEKEILAVERVSPLDLYPAALSTKPEDGDFFVRRRISDDAARNLRNLAGVLPDRLAVGLSKKPSGEDEVDTTLASITAKTTLGGDTEPDPVHELIYWWHWMTRKEVAGFLRSEEQPEDAVADDMVPMQGLMLNGTVIKAVPNLDASGRPNVFIASFRRRPGSFWGNGVAGLAKGQQEQVNVIARALNTNIHFSHRPSYQADQAALVDPKALAKTFPGQVIYTQLPPGDNRKPVEVLQTPNYTDQLIRARVQATSWLDEKSGIYPQSYGSPAQVGPAETLGGYQLLRQDQAKTIKRTLTYISEAVGGLVRAYWLYNMIFSEDESIKGDVEVVTSGIVSIYQTAEESGQMLAVLEMAAKNPVFAATLKPGAVAHIAREVLRSRRLDVDKLVKSEAEVEAEAMAAQQAAMAEQAAQEGPAQATEPLPRPDSESARVRAQADMIRAQAQAEKVGIEREKLAIERADRLMKIRKAQQELAQMRMAAATPAPMPAAQSEPAMGGMA